MAVRFFNTLFALLFLPVLAGVARSEPLLPGELVITEVMPIPANSASIPHGQWFELFNPGPEGLSLAGVELEVESEGVVSSYTVGALEAPVVTAGGFLVIGATGTLAFNGNIPVDYSWGLGWSLPLGGGVLRVVVGNVVVDEIVYGVSYGVGTAPGVSLQLEPGAFDSVANDSLPSWCPSTTLVGDGPSYGSPGEAGPACDSDGDGYSEDEGDCNDESPAIAPGTFEKCNGIDDDCNGSTDDDPLSDQPQWNATGVCAEGGPYCAGSQGWDFNFPEGFEPDESSCDELDNDCDGETDEGLINDCGYCGDAPIDVCDGIDNDCDGTTDEEPGEPPEGLDCPTLDEGICSEIRVVCTGEWKCSYPVGFEEEETLCDRVDNDCDGGTDEGYPVGEACVVGMGICQVEGTYVCTGNRLDVRCDAEPSLGTVEFCGDNVDNDCDGETDEGYPVGQACLDGEGICRQVGKYFCSPDGLSVVCSAEALDGQLELCGNQLDDDCDGSTDESDCTENVTPRGGCRHGGEPLPSLTILLLLAMALFHLMRRWKRVLP